MLDKLEFLKNLSDDERKLLSGVGLVLIGLFAVFFLSELLMIPSRLSARKRYAGYTGRALGKVTKRNIYSVEDGHDDDGHTTYKQKCFVEYEFTVGGTRYTGEGEGSMASRDKYETEICYDPSDPDQNCTACYFNSVTKFHILSTLIFLLCFSALVIGGLLFYFNIKG